MNVNLGSTFEEFVSKLIESGLYQSQSEVIREGLRLLKEREDLKIMRIAQLRSEVNRGLLDLDKGDPQELDAMGLKEVFEGSKQRGRKALQSKKTRAA